MPASHSAVAWSKCNHISVVLSDWPFKQCYSMGYFNFSSVGFGWTELLPLRERYSEMLHIHLSPTKPFYWHCNRFRKGHDWLTKQANKTTTQRKWVTVETNPNREERIPTILILGRTRRQGGRWKCKETHIFTPYYFTVITFIETIFGTMVGGKSTILRTRVTETQASFVRRFDAPFY